MGPICSVSECCSTSPTPVLRSLSGVGSPRALFGPWSGKGFGGWTPAVREREQQILAEALGLERGAMAEIEAALEASGAEIP